MSYDTPLRFDQLNRHGRRSIAPMLRQEQKNNRIFSSQQHHIREARRQAEGLAYRIAKRRGDKAGIKTFRKKHPKLAAQFKKEV